MCFSKYFRKTVDSLMINIFKIQVNTDIKQQYYCINIKTTHKDALVKNE